MAKVTVEVKGYQMRCGYCGVMKDYPSDFPNSIYAQCYNCWEEDIAKESRVTNRLKRAYWDTWVWIVLRSYLVRMWFIQHVVGRRKRKPTLDAMMKDAFALLEEREDGGV